MANADSAMVDEPVVNPDVHIIKTDIAIPPSRPNSASNPPSISDTPHSSTNSPQPQYTIHDEQTTVNAFTATVLKNRQKAAEEKLRRVRRVLQRANVSKAANVLRQRLEFATFKINRGWGEKPFSEVRELFSHSGNFTTANTPGSSTPCATRASTPEIGHTLPTPPSSAASTRTKDSQSHLHNRYPTLSLDSTAYVSKLRIAVSNKADQEGWSAYLKTKDSLNPYFPSPTPSPLGSRATSPAPYPADAEAEEGAMLLMMLQHKSH
ncbi:hypothetical protein DFS34DRAFT_258159 [Phlyctochytrium arcticum]|nr:hypothetical protein DFS34DRAFT_258159 [Phlyctochytrium arcticum]